jgi:hypothetical protein
MKLGGDIFPPIVHLSEGIIDFLIEITATKDFAGAYKA